MTQRKNIMLGTAGHVDHGKTSLVKLLTGCDTDTLAEEKRRGLTIELGFAPCRMRDERIVGVVDVPGHAGFIRNMVAGAAAIDVVILVVAADDGVMPQTREHLDILTLLGIRHGLVALTKIDLVDAQMRQLAADDVRGFVRGTFLENAAICPISNITGEGFDGFFEALNAAVEAAQPAPTTGCFRMWIERSFSIHGFGSVASGIPTSGQVSLGERLALLPGELTGRVRRLEVYGEDSPVGRSGECLAVNLSDVPHDQLLRGRVLCTPDVYEPATMLQAELRLLPHVPKPLKDYAEVHLHVGTAEVMANAALLEDKLLQPGASQLVQLRLAEPLAAAAGDRFVIRAGMSGLADGIVTTIGGGRIVSTGDIRLRRGKEWINQPLQARLEALDDPPRWVNVVLRESLRPLPLEQLARNAQMPAEQVAPLLADLAREGAAIDAGGGKYFHRDAPADLARPILAELEEFHQANPLRVGMEAGDLQARLSAETHIFQAALDRMFHQHQIERVGTLVAAAGRKAKLTPRDAKLVERIEQAYLAAGLSSPSPAELAAQLGEPPSRVSALVRLMCEQGILVALPEEIVMHASAVEEAKALATEMLAAKGGFETVEFRDALGVSRKYAVPLLDHFDSIGLTMRSGSRRTAGKKKP